MTKPINKKHNNALINAICPKGILFNKDTFSYGNNECVAMSCMRYPSTVDYEWLLSSCNLQNTITSLTFTPEDNVEATLKSLSTTISNYKSIADGFVPKSAVEVIRAKKIVNDASDMVEQVGNNNESIGYLSMNMMSIGNDVNDVKSKSRGVRQKCIGNNFNVYSMPFLQKEIYKTISPIDIPNIDIENATNHLMPISTVIGGFPFSSSGYNDGKGSYFGMDDSKYPIIIDMYKRGKDRNNSNMVVLGLSGVGKSTILKHLILNEWDLGAKIIIIDPHGEYKEMCENLSGDWIDICGGSKGRINPLHIYSKFDNEDVRDENMLSELAKHINNLEVFFKLYLELSPILTAILKECIEITYKNAGIVWDTNISKIRNDQFPIMIDLYNVTLQKSKEEEPNLKRAEENYYKTLSILLRNIAIGSDAQIWNGYSTVNPKKDFVVFDTTSLNNNASNIKTALYHTLLNYCEDYLYRDKNEKVILIVDEAHNIIDRNLPATTQRFANIEKSCRKLEGALWICSQQLIDFLDEAIKKDGETLLGQPTFKLLMPVGRGTDLKSLKELYNLTDAQEEKLSQQMRGQGLLFVGNRRMSIDCEIPKFRFDDMGTGGGR